MRTVRRNPRTWIQRSRPPWPAIASSSSVDIYETIAIARHFSSRSTRRIGAPGCKFFLDLLGVDVARLAAVSVAVVLCAVLTLRAGPGSTSAPFAAVRDAAATPAVAPRLSPNDTIKEYCTGCHNQYDLKGELDLESFDVAKAADHAATGEKMIRKLRAGLMPPKGEPQPDRDTRLTLVAALETTLDKAAVKPMPGRRTFQRLNRAEYAAAVKTLFSIDVDVAQYLP